jgi:hypothetical protein
MEKGFRASSPYFEGSRFNNNLVRLTLRVPYGSTIRQSCAHETGTWHLAPGNSWGFNQIPEPMTLSS